MNVVRVGVDRVIEVISVAPIRLWVALGGVFGLMTFISWRESDGFVPDSRYYVARAYHFAGSSQDEAAAIVKVFTDQRGWSPLDATTLFTWDLVEPRIVYPLLSAPFVWLFGVRGMYVIPVLSMAFLILGMFAFASRRYGARAAFLSCLLVSVSFYMMWFGTAMLTEGLSAALGAAILMTTPLHAERGRRALILCGVLIVALAFTRQAAVLPAGGIAGAWIGSVIAERRLRTPWAPFAAVSVGLAVGVQLLQSWIWPSFSVFTYYKQKTGTTELGEAVNAAPDVLWNIIVSDYNNYVDRDRPLLILLALALVASVALIKRAESHLFLGALGAAIVLNTLNTVPTGFRYAMPILAFVMVVVAAFIGDRWPGDTGSGDDLDEIAESGPTETSAVTAGEVPVPVDDRTMREGEDREDSVACS